MSLAIILNYLNTSLKQTTQKFRHTPFPQRPKELSKNGTKSTLAKGFSKRKKQKSKYK